MAEPARALLDASALVAWLKGERGADAIDRLIAVCAISSVNLAESLEHASGTAWRQVDTIADLRACGLAVLPFEADDAAHVPIVRRAGRALSKVRTNALSLGDCCCIATARRHGIPVITGDAAWTALDLGVMVHLFR
jgi:ribonuclease VapC